MRKSRSVRIPCISGPDWLRVSPERNGVAAETIVKRSCDAPNSGNTDSGQFSNLAVRQVLLQQLCDLPPVNQSLQFGWCTQILDEVSTLMDIGQGCDYAKKGVFRALLVDSGVISIRFHVINLYSCASTLVQMLQRLNPRGRLAWKPGFRKINNKYISICLYIRRELSKTC